MEAAHMTFKEEALRLRLESKNLRQENARFKKRSNNLLIKTLRLEKENLVLKKENLLLKQRQLLLLEKQQQLQKQIESLTLIVEELRRMIFGKKKTKGNGDKSSEGTNSDTNNGQTNKRKSANRAKDSYRRAAPKEEEITDTYEHGITHCSECGTLLIKLKQITRYIEDIANLINLSKLLKKIDYLQKSEVLQADITTKQDGRYRRKDKEITVGLPDQQREKKQYS